MNDSQRNQLIGVGILSGDPQEDMADAIQITTFLLRHFAHMAGERACEIDLAQHLQNARRVTRPVDAHYTLRLAVLPATEALRLPADHIALLTVTTRHWKRGRARVAAATDALIAEFLSRTRRSPDQVKIQCIPHTRARRYFAYQVLISWAERAVGS
ncbi:MAG: hypothetical protein ACJ8CR_23650 [Roseiflexaceae bacterium]